MFYKINPTRTHSGRGQKIKGFWKHVLYDIQNRPKNGNHAKNLSKMARQIPIGAMGYLCKRSLAILQ